MKVASYILSRIIISNSHNDFFLTTQNRNVSVKAASQRMGRLAGLVLSVQSISRCSKDVS